MNTVSVIYLRRTSTVWKKKILRRENYRINNNINK